MSPERLLKHFEQISEAPDAVPRLRGSFSIWQCGLNGGRPVTWNGLWKELCSRSVVPDEPYDSVIIGHEIRS